MRTFMIVAFFAAVIGTASAQGTSSSPSPTPSASASGSPTDVASPIADDAQHTIEGILKASHAEAGAFSDDFLSKVTIDQVNALLGRLALGLGEFKRIDGAKGDYTAHFAKGSDEIIIRLNSASKIEGLFFKPPKLEASSLDGALDTLRALKGTAAFVIVEDRSQREALNPSLALAVGSAFKLAVLSALRDEIAKGRLHWTDVIPLDESKKSLPSGTLQTWPAGLPITIASYAAEMISISDNTAADALVRADGPAALATYAKGNAPFLTTREMFVLKSKPAEALRNAYLKANAPSQRAAILRTVDTMALPADGDMAASPILGVEWRYSVVQLCDLMSNVAAIPLMSINPGVADPKDFRDVAFKGGSDTGVIDLTTQVTTKRGTKICFSATINDPEKEIDEQGFEGAYGAVLSALKTH